MLEAIEKSLDDAKVAIDAIDRQFIADVAQLLADQFGAGHQLIVAGNGGSMCDAMHFAEEFTGQFRKKRKALPAIALCEQGHLTCVANDFGFDEVFARGVEAFGRPGDVFVGLSTSGNSANLIRAFEEAQQLHTVAFLGKDGGKLKGVADYEMIIPGTTSDRIQEAHMLAIHTIIERVESLMFSPCPVYSA